MNRIHTDREPSETNRLEAFSDGVFAVAITLLAFNLTVPRLANGAPVTNLGQALFDQWPVYLTYIVSFLTILVMWINHHALFKMIRRTDHTFLLLNGGLLLLVTAVPFATALLSTYLLQPDSKIAQGIYAMLQLVLAIFYNSMLLYATRHRRLLKADIEDQSVGTYIRQYAFGPLLDILALGLDIFSAQASLGVCILMVLFFSLPPSLTMRRRPEG